MGDKMQICLFVENKTIANKLIYIPKIIPSVNYNKWLKRMDTQLNEPTNLNLIKN